MSISNNEYDAIERMIFEDGISIEAIDFHPESDLMLILLNTKAVLKQKISSYKGLADAKKEALLRFELIGGGTGVSWPELDEDLSLKGFLRDELKNFVHGGSLSAA